VRDDNRQMGIVVSVADTTFSDEERSIRRRRRVRRR